VDTGLVEFVVGSAAFVLAVGVLWRALRALTRTLHEVDVRVRRLLDLTEQGSDDEP
jgi:hypothetical protein